MGLSAEALKESLDALAKAEPKFAAALERVGYPEPRISERGYVTLLRAIVGQQVSIHAARSIWARLEAAVGDVADPAAMIATGEDALRAAGLSRQKMSYAHSLAEEIASGRLDLDDLPEEDEAAIGQLTQVKGIGRWSAEVYLLFAEGRPDIWPAGDLAVQNELGRLLALSEKPGERRIRELSIAWRPHRGALAIFCWHHYRTPVL